MAVERIEGGFQKEWQLQGIEHSGFSTALLRHLAANVLPEVAEFRHLAAGYVVRHRHPRELDDAAFNSIHQAEVADRPRKQRPLGIPGAAQEERGRG